MSEIGSPTTDPRPPEPRAAVDHPTSDEAGADGPGGQPPDSPGHVREVGKRLRAVRSQQRLSLHGVELKSGGRWKAVVVGSYERGERTVSVARLAGLAEFYNVPITELLPPSDRAGDGKAKEQVVVDLQKLSATATDLAVPLIRYAHAIQRERGDYANRVLSLRGTDLHALGLLYDIPVEQLTDLLHAWDVLG
jgi:transcriptional regulator with XRE-family HTH domain